MRIVGGIDIETTDLDWTSGARIIEFGIVLHDADTGSRLGEWVQRINPECPIGAKAFAIHHISFEMLSGCPKFAEVAPRIQALMSKCDYWVAHNGKGFDMPFISHELLKAGFAAPERPLVDTMLEGRWATFSGKSPKLGELCYALDVDYNPNDAHSAQYDIDRMMQCYFKGAAEGFFARPGAPLVSDTSVKELQAA